MCAQFPVRCLLFPLTCQCSIVSSVCMFTPLSLKWSLPEPCVHGPRFLSSCTSSDANVARTAFTADADADFTSSDAKNCCTAPTNRPGALWTSSLAIVALTFCHTSDACMHGAFFRELCVVKFNPRLRIVARCRGTTWKIGDTVPLTFAAAYPQ